MLKFVVSRCQFQPAVMSENLKLAKCPLQVRLDARSDYSA